MTVKRPKHERITRINSKVGRDINRSIILNTVRRHQPISRAELAEITRLNKSTVSSIVASLIAEDLLTESPDLGGGVGRIPVNLSVKHGMHFVGAMSLDAPRSLVAIVDIDGTVRARDEILTNASSPDRLVSQCVARLRDLRATLGPHRFHGVGASVAGIVDTLQSQVVYAANLGWSDVHLGTMIHAQLPEAETVSVENDAKAAALAELLFGRHNASTTNLVFLWLGAGIGAGITVNGRVLSGNTHAAGEVGHMTVVEGGAPCPCGNQGCWELYASERAPVQWYAAATPSDASGPPLSISAVFDAARAGDTHAREALRRWGQHIGVGIGDMISILDPEAVVVGGSITQVWPLVESHIVEAARGRGTFSRQRTTTILPTSLPDNPPLLGAAALCIRKVFADYSMSL